MENQLYRIGLGAFVICSLFGILYLKFLVPRFTMPCVFYTLLGLYCPGCGGTRAIEALLHGEWLASLWYHPVVLYTAVVYAGFMLTHTLEKLHIGRVHGWKFHSWWLFTALAIVIGNWIFKNILLLMYNVTL